MTARTATAARVELRFFVDADIAAWLAERARERRMRRSAYVADVLVRAYLNEKRGANGKPA